jgi:hypothetical protein
MKYRASITETIIPAALKSCLLCVLFSAPLFLLAQTRGKVEVVKDPKVDSLVEGYIVSGKGNAQPLSSEGFRVQIFSGSDRSGAYTAQARFQDKYPELRTYISYREPDFKVRVGDFRTRLEAEKMMQELRRSFTGTFIIPDKINPPKLDTQ